MDWVVENALLVIALVASALGVWWLMPRRIGRPRSIGLILAIGGCGLLGWSLYSPADPFMEGLLFGIFATAAIVCGALMITSRNPVYGALWFALVTLSTCGLFLLQSAPFLAAATIIVYAGAIVVTFLFVIMLSQQSGATAYDQRSRQPLAATVVAFILLGALLYTLHDWGARRSTSEPGAASAVAAETNPLSRPNRDEPLGTMHGLGRSLFGDYLFAVELAGTLLLIASIGAIAMAPKRPQGTL